jgi:hypothetical protein
MRMSGMGKRYALIVVLAGFTALAFSQQTTTPATPVDSKAANSSSATPTTQTPTSDSAAKSEASSDPQSSPKPDVKSGEVKPDDASSLPQSEAGADVGTPSTTAMPETKEVKSIDSMMQPPPLPNGKVSLIGGTVEHIDQIRNRMVVDIYGKGKMKVFFDERSHVYRSGVETTQLAIHKGDRVYVDTQSAQGKIFARNIQIATNIDAASVSGQIVSFNGQTGALVLHDPLSAQPVSLKLTPASVITQQGQPGSRGDLLPDSLVTVRFSPVAGRPIKEVEVLARKGAQFPFYGTLTHLDLRNGLLAVENKSDGKIYDIHFVPARIGVTDQLTPGAEVAVAATFDGHNYTAQTVKVTRVAQTEKPSDDQDKAKEEKPR